MNAPCPAWLGDLCRGVDGYCERTTTALGAEPLNAITNLAFILAAIAAWRLANRHAAGTYDRVLILIIAVIGVGSVLFHTFATAWAGIADVAPITLFMLLYLWLALRRFLGFGVAGAIAGLAVFVAAGALLGALPQDLFPGATYLPALVAMVVVGLLLRKRAPATSQRLIIAGTVFAASYFFRSIDRSICEAVPFGTHFLWHVLNATVLYLLMRTAILAPRARASG
jgi:hypothetical protein